MMLLQPSGTPFGHCCSALGPRKSVLCLGPSTPRRRQHWRGRTPKNTIHPHSHFTHLLLSDSLRRVASLSRHLNDSMRLRNAGRNVAWDEETAAETTQAGATPPRLFKIPHVAPLCSEKLVLFAPKANAPHTTAPPFTGPCAIWCDGLTCPSEALWPHKPISSKRSAPR